MSFVDGFFCTFWLVHVVSFSNFVVYLTKIGFLQKLANNVFQWMT